eukprot:s2195_g9.t1
MSSSSAATVADRLGEALAAARRMGFAPVVGLLSTDQVAERRCLLKGRTDSAPEEMHVPATTAPSCGWGVARPLILIVAASLTSQHINDRLRGLRVEARRRSGFEMEHSTRTAGSISDDPSRGWSRRGKKAWTYETVDRPPVLLASLALAAELRSQCAFTAADSSANCLNWPLAQSVTGSNSRAALFDHRFFLQRPHGRVRCSRFMVSKWDWFGAWQGGVLCRKMVEIATLA